jgi:hypothetical protein
MRTFQPGDAVILADDIRHINRGEWVTYGRKHEVVKVISVAEHVLIVEGKERYSITIDKVK